MHLLRCALPFLLLMLLSGAALQAQVAIPGTKVQYTFPSKWNYLTSKKVDQNTTVYHYYYTAKILVSKGDTALPYLLLHGKRGLHPDGQILSLEAA